jgi:hypothetical protein
MNDEEWRMKKEAVVSYLKNFLKSLAKNEENYVDNG